MILPGGVKRIEGTFTDENGSAYDPSSAVIKIYDKTGTLQATKALTDCVRVALGQWYLDYVLSSTAVVGRWTVSWVNTVAGKDYAYPYAFIVWDLLGWPTIAEIRSFLADMGTRRLSDASIETQIASAAEIYTYEKIDTVPDHIVNEAVKLRAIYLSYLAYAAEYERTAGKLPDPLDRQLQRYARLSDNALLLIQATIAGKGKQLVSGGMVSLVQLRGNSIEDNS